MVMLMAGPRRKYSHLIENLCKKPNHTQHNTIAFNNTWIKVRTVSGISVVRSHIYLFEYSKLHCTVPGPVAVVEFIYYLLVL